MIAKMIANCTRILGKSQGYLGLPVLDTKLPDGTPCMVTMWEPTPAELAALNAGASVQLCILGNAHPPVSVDVGPVPERTE